MRLRPFRCNMRVLFHKATDMNSTTVLQKLEELASNPEVGSLSIDITALAAMLDITNAILVSLLTELEQRDEIIMEISSKNDPLSNEIEYTGNVRLMERPPDELRSI